ncbi:hypothetical protein BJ741DRAFT_704370 [Chytriomyces cf. hyalinus JEL632]|nr:hypothetical protein BJ741DRAFT_704370 [Chytriomyces cf. hyalinus JEL632]
MAEEAYPTSDKARETSASKDRPHERGELSEQVIPVDLFAGRNKKVSAAVSAEHVLVLRHSATKRPLFTAPVPLVALKLLSLSVTNPSQGKVLNMFRRRKSVPAPEPPPAVDPGTGAAPTGVWANYTRSSLAATSQRVHFQVLSPSLTNPLFLFALNMEEFNTLRCCLDNLRLTALAGNAKICCDIEASEVERTDLDLPCTESLCPPLNANGSTLLQWLRSRDPSNKRCGGCGCCDPPPSWAAVYKSGDTAVYPLVVCDNCSGFYRGVPDFAVRSFLLDVSVFEDKSSYIYKGIITASNYASCMSLARIATTFEPTLPLRLFFKPPEPLATAPPCTDASLGLKAPNDTASPLQPRRASDHTLDYTFTSHRITNSSLSTSKSNPKIGTSTPPQKRAAAPFISSPLSSRVTVKSGTGAGFSMNLAKTQSLLSRMVLHRSNSGHAQQQQRPHSALSAVRSHSRPASPHGSLYRTTGECENHGRNRGFTAESSPTDVIGGPFSCKSD